MSDLKTKFDQAAEEVQKLAKRPDPEMLLNLYALYKQSTKGNTTGKRPGIFDQVGRAKYDAWAKVDGLSSDEAMQRYIDLVATLQ